MTPAERAARERKQKIFVVIGGLFLVGLVAIQLPRLLGGGSSGASATPPTTAPMPSGSTATPATPTTSSQPASLVSGDRQLAAAPGQLSSFAGFKGKDPFVQQVHFSDSPVAGSSAPTTGKSGVKGTKSGSKTSTRGFSVGQQPQASMTVVSVNGARQALVPGTRFPAADPVFVLVAERLESKSVVVGIAGGAYASGSRTTKLVVGKPLVLVNTTTGARYKLVLVAVGNGQSTNAGAGSTQQKPTKKTPATAP